MSKFKQIINFILLKINKPHKSILENARICIIDEKMFR